jgi:membrane associated rhomboid family serine protease
MKQNSYSPYYHFGIGGLTPPAVKRLLIANGIVFLLQILSRQGFSHIFGLVPAYFMGRFWIWQAVTYMFLHGGLFHIFFNMFALWMFGSDIERQWGEKEFLKYYFLTGISAGILTYLSSPRSPIPTVGASGAIFGLLVAYGMMFPDRLILVSFIFPMKAKHFVLLFAAIEFMYCASGTQDGIGHFAHLGGMLVGFVYLKYWPRLSLKMGLFHGIGWRVKEWHKETQKKEEAVFDEKVDAILDKINREGIDSLSSSEKEILRRYRQRK